MSGHEKGVMRRGGRGQRAGRGAVSSWGITHLDIHGWPDLRALMGARPCVLKVFVFTAMVLAAVDMLYPSCFGPC